MDEEPYEDPIEQLKLMNRWLGHIASRLEVLAKQQSELLAVVQSIATDVDRMDTNVNSIDDSLTGIAVDTDLTRTYVNSISVDVDLMQDDVSSIAVSASSIDAGVDVIAASS